jgi:hypothetical protein
MPSTAREQPGVALLLTQLIEQHLRIRQVRRIETLSEPAVNRREEITRVCALSLFAPEPGQAGGGRQLPSLGPLFLRHCKGTVKTSFDLSFIRVVKRNKPLALVPVQLCFEPPFARSVSPLQRCGDQGERFVSLTCAFVTLSEQTKLVRLVVLQSRRCPVSHSLAGQRKSLRSVTTCSKHIPKHNVCGCQPDRKAVLHGQRP